MEGKNKKTKVFKWAAVLMLAAMMIVGCKQAQGNNSKEEKYEVTVSAGSNGKVTVAPELPTDKKVAKGQELTITATANTGYVVDKWTVTPADALQSGGTAGSDTAMVKVSAATTVNVTFKPVGGTPSTPPSGDVGSFEDTGDGFIKISPPAAGITGKDPTHTLPGMEEYWKGVFREERKVTLSPYKLGKTEVPYKLWKEVYDWAVKAENGYRFANAGVKGKDGSGTEEEPVTMVSWRDCIVWCNAYTHKTNNAESECVYRKSATDTTVLKNANDTTAWDAAYADMSKKGYRLPTEAEWEYAARWQGSDSTNADKYGEVWLTKLNSVSGAKGNWEDAEKTGEVAWYSGNADSKTHPVGIKKANALGLHDMSGNVWEWCFDRYEDNPRANDAAYTSGGFVVDPQGGAAGVFRVFRGGSWYHRAKDCVVGSRSGSAPGYGSVNVGFRLACRP
ncbi:MAG: SUMF1/EgtB/PvdO family nonheme iron enzyme [Treponema sp.]|uniref:SUMF1/EgtB/PvdO family nonheme iron enzyme n=1 Tax=Treponema sp. TaxID=166 RepID=UPI003FA25CD1